MAVRVLDHPVTDGAASGSNTSTAGAVIGLRLLQLLGGVSVGFNGLNAMDNAILIHQMTVHHEGFDVYFGNQDAINLRHGNNLPASY